MGNVPLPQKGSTRIRSSRQGVSISSLSLPALTIASPAVTTIRGIYDLPIYDLPIYDLGGRKIVNSKSVNSKLHRGIYIRNGKKIVVKK
jgi:hypothetical protein